MISNSKQAILLYFLLFICGLSQAQSDSSIDHIGSEDGLTSQLCQNLVEDQYGNLWISSFEDVQKYDGYSVTVFPKLKVDNIDLDIMDLLHDQNGNIWVLQGSRGSREFKKYISTSDNFHISIIKPLTGEQLSFHEYIESEMIDQKDIKSVQTIGDQIILISHQNKVFTFTTTLEPFFDDNDPTKEILLSQDFKIIEYDDEQMIFKNLSGKEIERLDSMSMSKYSAFSISENGHIFFLSEIDNNVNIVQYRNKKFKHLMTLGRENFPQLGLKYARLKLYDDSKLLVNLIFSIRKTQ